jgi:membrane protease YdiL (CAAX protease family)
MHTRISKPPSEQEGLGVAWPLLASAWPFFALTLALSWLFWGPAALFRLPVGAFPGSLLLGLGGVGPATAAIALTYLARGHATRGSAAGDYWRRVIDVRRIGPLWWAAIACIIPAIKGLALLLDRFTGGPGVPAAGALSRMSSLLQIVPLALFLLVFGPLPEELGWRGYALDRLQARWSALLSSLFLGVAWAVWHLPLFVMCGTYQSGLGLGTRAFWLFMFNLLPASVLYTWIYNHTRRSTLSAILLHWSVNLTGELVPLFGRAEVYESALLAVAAIAVILVWGPRTLSGKHPEGAGFR